MGEAKNEVSDTRQAMLTSLRGLHPRSSRSSSWWQCLIFRQSKRWTGWAFPAPHSTAPSRASLIPCRSMGYDRYLTRGEAGLKDRSPKPKHVWNRIPDDIRDRIVKLALEIPELSPRELAVRFSDTERYFVSEASVYRILKAHDLITSPAFIVIKAANEFKDKTTAINQLWQTDFTYLKVIPSRDFATQNPVGQRVGAGSICPRFWMITAAISLPGSCAPPPGRVCAACPKGEHEGRRRHRHAGPRFAGIRL